MQRQLAQGHFRATALAKVATLLTTLAVAAPALAAPQQVMVRVRTFVQQPSYLANPLTCQGAVTIGGDNRGPSGTSTAWRTSFNLMREFKTNAGALSTLRSNTKHSSQTRGYDIWGTLVATATPSTANMSHAIASTSNTQTTWALAHSMKNGLCSDALASDYNLNVRVTNTNQVTVTGTHEIYPSLEIYASKNNGLSWVQVYHSSGTNILCLASDLPGCAKKSVNVTKAL